MAEDGSAVGGTAGKFALLSELKGELDGCDAELGEMVEPVEAAFEALHLGVPITLTIEDGIDWTTYLTFTKVGKRWRLCVETGPNDGDADDWTLIPLSDAPRDRRAEVFEKFLPRFLDAAIDQVKFRIGERRRIIASSKTLVQELSNVLAEQTRVPGTHRYAGSSAEDATADPHPALGVFGDNHPGMESTKPSDVLAALARKRGKQATLGVPRRKP